MARKRILAIDDDPGIRDCLFEVFSVVGYEFVSAQNGKEGLDFLERAGSANWPDLIILDNRMPVMSGEDFLEELRKRYPEEGKKVPILYFSATKGISVPEEGPRWKVNVLEKLTDLEVLLKIVRNLIGPPDETPLGFQSEAI